MRRVFGNFRYDATSGPGPSNSGVPSSRHTRSIDPPAQRPLPREASTTRAVPRPGVFRRHATTIIGYAVALLAALIVAAIGYTAFAFSSYQGVILPNVYVNNVNLSGMTPAEAQLAIENQLNNIRQSPVRFSYGKHVWLPTMSALGIQPDFVDTAANAYSIGRTGDFFQNLIDRLPVKRHFNITLLYTPRTSPAWSTWIQKNLAQPLDRASIDAWIAVDGDRAVVEPGANGRHVDIQTALQNLQSNLASLKVHTFPVPLVTDRPYISDASAKAVVGRINAFLAHPPTLIIDHQKVKPDPAVLASYLAIGPRPQGQGVIAPQIRANLSEYIDQLIAPYDRAVQNPVYQYNAGQVSVVKPARNGLTYGSAFAASRFTQFFKTWTLARRSKSPGTASSHP